MSTPVTPSTPTTPDTTAAAANPAPSPAPVPPAAPAVPAESVSTAASAVFADVKADVAEVTPLWQQARDEYDKLAPEAQGKIHQLYNDLETLYGSALPALHTFFGAK